MPKHVSQIITERILGMLSEGFIPWEKPYLVGSGAARGYEMPKDKEYTGINRILLPLPGEYLTKRMVEKYGGAIIDEEKFFIATFFKTEEVRRRSDEEDGEMVVDGVRKVFRYYRVYHISNTTGIPSKCAPRKAEDIVPNRDAEELIRTFTARTGMDIVTDTLCGAPYYDTETSTAYLPGRESFINDESYYAAFFHQAVLSSFIGVQADPAKAAQALRTEQGERTLADLVAEMGSAMLMGHCGLDTAKVIRNSAALIQRWTLELQADSHLVIMAASQAEKAVAAVIGDEAATLSAAA